MRGPHNGDLRTWSGAKVSSHKQYASCVAGLSSGAERAGTSAGVDSVSLVKTAPPLYRLSRGATTFYARDDAHKDEIMAKEFKGNGKVDVSRFKGLGEMPPQQLRTTAMDPATRTLLRVTLADGTQPPEPEAAAATANLVETLMGRKPELRFQYIQKHARFVDEIDV